MTDDKTMSVTLQRSQTTSHVHLRGVFGDSGENEGVLSVCAVLDATGNYPSSGLIVIGSPSSSPLLDGYIPNLGCFSCGLEGAERLVEALQNAIRDVRASLTRSR